MKKTDEQRHMEEMAKLTDKQEKFCYEYVLHLNATKAAINAGYSEKTAFIIGSENLRKPYIKERIRYMQDNLAETAQLSALRVLKEHEKIAFNDEEKTADKQKSLDSINNMLGYNAPTKNEYSGDAININFINHSKSQ
jgi:phage terminase small subunit